MKAVSREIGLLRTIAANLEQRPLPSEPMTQAYLQQNGFAQVRLNPGKITAIRVPGRTAFTELSECLAERLPAMARGTAFAHVQTELLAVMEAYFGRLPDTIEAKDVEALVAHFEQWYARQAHTQRVFVPCLISPWDSPAFEIGPVRFVFVDDVKGSDFYPKGADALDVMGMKDMLDWMRPHRADRLARVIVEGCEKSRAEEVAELAVDLTLVSLQLIAPHLDTASMSRLDGRRGTHEKRTLSEYDGHFAGGWSRKEPGLSIGHGTLQHILHVGAAVVAAVGRFVTAFASGTYRLPVLETAWCDAAYWLHQALAESIDTIAVTKLETALEVLVAAESTAGSKARMLDILRAFFDIGPNDPIYPGSMLTADKFAKNLVRDRSRILHGTWSTLNARGMDRAGLTGFVVTVLRMAAIEIDAYAQSPAPSDTIDGLLAWIAVKKIPSTS